MNENSNIAWNAPWLKSLREQLVTLYNNKELPQAILLTGGSGLGKKEFIQAFAKYLLCSDKQDTNPCGNCTSCIILQTMATEHFDLISFPATTIGIAEIRALEKFIYQQPRLNLYKIAIIPANNLTLSAINALLKILEEPPIQRYIFLTCSEKYLPATIVSRCNIFKVNLPNKSQWQAIALKMNLKSPLPNTIGPFKLLSWQNKSYVPATQILHDWSEYHNNRISAFNIITKWENLDTQQMLYWLYVINLDLIKVKMGITIDIIYEYELSILFSLSKLLSLQKLWCFADKLQRSWALQQSKINSRLLLEDLLINDG